MNYAERLMIFALAFNIIVLTPVVSALLFDVSQIENGLGPATEGRLILTSVYIAIALVSAGLIAMQVKKVAWAVPMTVALFSVQITYKLITVPMVGLSNPVVITNLIVVAVQAFSLFGLWRLHRKPKITIFS